jgi:hypothetical protein
MKDKIFSLIFLVSALAVFNFLLIVLEILFFCDLFSSWNSITG